MKYLLSIRGFFLFIIYLSLLKANSNFLARIIKIEGRVNIKRMGKEYFDEKAKLGLAISNGDEIKVGANSFCAVMYLDDKSIVKIRENSNFGFMDTQNTRTIDLKYGILLNNVKSKVEGRVFRIQTPVSVASVKGTKFAVLSSQSGVDQFIGKEGLFEVLNIISGETVSVRGGQKAVSNSSGSLIQAPASPKEYPNDPEIEEYEEIKKEKEQESIKETKNNNNIDLNSDSDNDSKDFDQMQEELDNDLDEFEEITTFDEDEYDDSLSNDKGPSPKPFAMGLGIGSATIDGVLYNQLALRPEINIGKIGIGLDLILYIDNEGNIRNDEWEISNDPSLLLDKILYIKYGQKTDQKWIKYGSIEAMTLGYGGLMNNYSNMMEFPSVRRVGINAGFNIGPVGGEVFVSNLKDISRGGTISGLRFSYTVSKTFPLSIGINYVVDANMFSSLKDKDEDSFPDIFDDFPDDSTLWNDTDGDGWPDPGHGDSISDSLVDIDADNDNIIDKDEDPDSLALKAIPFSLRDNVALTNGLSFDVGYPILKSKVLNLIVYAEYNSLIFPSITTSDSSFIRPKRSGTGISIPGIRSTFFNIVNISLEYRIINGSYIPQFFDQAYDLNRVITSTLDDGSTSISTKDMSVFKEYNDSTSSSGFFGSAGLSLFELVNFSVSYANMKAQQTELKSFFALLNLNTDNIPKISSAMGYYQRNNDDNPFDFENPTKNTIMGYRIGYEISKGVSLIWDFRQFYRDNGTGKLDPIKQTTIETSFNF